MRNKSKEELLEDALKGSLWELEKMSPTLQTLFQAAIKSLQDLDGLQLQPQRKANLLEVMERGATLQRAQEIYAASIFLVLDQWIKALRKRLDLEKDKTEFGEQIAGARLAPLIWATANNFRHYDQWANPNELAKINIRILEAAGIHDFRDTNIAPFVLQVLQVKTYEQLEAKVSGIGQDMLNRARVLLGPES
jgi:hypothetical protein